MEGGSNLLVGSELCAELFDLRLCATIKLFRLLQTRFGGGGSFNCLGGVKGVGAMDAWSVLTAFNARNSASHFARFSWYCSASTTALWQATSFIVLLRFRSLICFSKSFSFFAYSACVCGFGISASASKGECVSKGG